MSKNIIVFCVSFLMCSLFLFGCSKQKSNNFIKIKTISPSTLKPLNVGEVVEIEVEIEYKVTNVPATITLNIQKGESQGDDYDAVIASIDEVVFEKKKTISMKYEFKVPETRAIKVYTPLTVEGQVSTTIVDVRGYQVLP